jgi:hypothetical protein
MQSPAAKEWRSLATWSYAHLYGDGGTGGNMTNHPTRHTQCCGKAVTIKEKWIAVTTEGRQRRRCPLQSLKVVVQ